MRIAPLLLSPDASLRDALRAMESPPKHDRPVGIVLVVDRPGRLIGVLTDGDVRRAMLADRSLDEPIERFMTRDPIAIHDDELATNSYQGLLARVHTTHRMMDLSSGGKIIIVDREQRPIDIVALYDILRRQNARSQAIAVVGMGFVGLTLAVSLAESGLRVHGIETDAAARATLLNGESHFHEPGLPRLLAANLGRMLSIHGAIDEVPADAYLVCVGTPVDAMGQPQLGHLSTAVAGIGRRLRKGQMVVIRSTVPIGTTRSLVIPCLEDHSGLVAGRDFDLAYAPERTIAGNALAELRSLPQVIGALNSSGLERATALFRELTHGIIAASSLEEAEAVKLLNNSFRDHVFAFANEAALICARAGLDAARVIQAANEGYPRNPIPAASPGVGGSCLSKDPHLLHASALAVGYEPVLIGRSRHVNRAVLDHLRDRLLAFLATRGGPSRVFVIGFAFKGEPATSDLRDSSTLALVASLVGRVDDLVGFDPVIDAATLGQIAGVRPVEVAEGFAGSDAAIVMNNHASYRHWPIDRLLATMRRPALFIDGWRLFEPHEICQVEGVTYGALGIDYGLDALGRLEIRRANAAAKPRTSP